jgi:hypothetical protein
MININGIQILDSWDGSRENVSVVVSQPQRVYGSFLLKDELPPLSTIIALFKNDKAISHPFSLIAYEPDMEVGIQGKIEGLKKVFGPDIQIIRQ